MANWNEPENIGFVIDEPKIKLAFVADMSGTWVLQFDDDITQDFDAVEGEYLQFLPTYFDEQGTKFIIRKPDDVILNNKVYILYLSTDTISETQTPITVSGDKQIVIDPETEEGYTLEDTIEAKQISVFKNGLLQQTGIDHDALTGEFDWAFSEGDIITIKWFK